MIRDDVLCAGPDQAQAHGVSDGGGQRTGPSAGQRDAAAGLTQRRLRPGGGAQGRLALVYREQHGDLRQHSRSAHSCIVVNAS